MAWADAFRTPGLRLDATIRSALGDVESRVCRAPFAHCEDGYLAVRQTARCPSCAVPVWSGVPRRSG